MRGLVVIVSAALALTACDAPPPAAAPPAAPPAAGPAPAAAAPAASFADAVRERAPELALDRRDEELQAIADQACAGLAAGRGTDAVLTGSGADAAAARTLLRLAVDTTCPGQRPRLG